MTNLDDISDARRDVGEASLPDPNLCYRIADFGYDGLLDDGCVIAGHRVIDVILPAPKGRHQQGMDNHHQGKDHDYDKAHHRERIPHEDADRANSIDRRLLTHSPLNGLLAVSQHRSHQSRCGDRGLRGPHPERFEEGG